MPSLTVTTSAQRRSDQFNFLLTTVDKVAFLYGYCSGIVQNYVQLLLNGKNETF